MYTTINHAQTTKIVLRHTQQPHTVIQQLQVLCHTKNVSLGLPKQTQGYHENHSMRSDSSAIWFVAKVYQHLTISMPNLWQIFFL
jgi:hypothetical protein